VAKWIKSPRAFLLVISLAIGCGGPPPAASPSNGPNGQPAGAGGTEQAPGGNPDEGWEKIREEDGITVFRKEVEGSPLVAFRGEGEIDAPIARVALIQMDIAHGTEWVEKMVDARVIEIKSDAEYLTYSHIGAPPLVTDREFVNQVKVDFTAPTHIKFNLHSVEDPRAPATDYVRGALLHSSFDLTAVSPTKTRIVCEIHADPKGSLPKFVVNIFQKNWAFNTITRLRKQTVKEGVIERAPQIKEILTRQGFTAF
jgi:hypothetical protein